MSELKSIPIPGPEALYRGLMEVNQKSENAMHQLFNTSLVIEYLIKRMNEFKLADGSTPLAVDEKELMAFAEARTKEVQQEMEKAIAELQASTAKAKLDLSE